MTKKQYTAIKTFMVVNPTSDFEQVGDEITLHETGEYRAKKTDALVGYSLLELISHSAHYRISEIIMHGINYVIPADREFNYKPNFHRETKKYYLGNIKPTDIILKPCMHDWDEGNHGVHKCKKCGKFNC